MNCTKYLFMSYELHFDILFPDCCASDLYDANETIQKRIMIKQHHSLHHNCCIFMKQ